MEFKGEELTFYTVRPYGAEEDLGKYKVFTRRNVDTGNRVNVSSTIDEMKKFLIEAYQDHMNRKGRYLKVFISQPYTGYSEEEIFSKREMVVEKYIKPNSIRDVYVIDQYHRPVPDHPYRDGRIYNLGQSISMMEDADVIFFVKDFQKSQGCIAEHTIAQLYQTLYKWAIMYEDENWQNEK